MGCCGQKRSALAGNVAVNQAAIGAIPGPGSSVPVEFTRRTSIIVRGPLTGRAYRFHEGAYVQSMDPRDAASLIATGYFRQVERS